MNTQQTQNSQATQQGIISQELFTKSDTTTEKYSKFLNSTNNTNYSVTPNAVKLLPIVSNDRNYIKLYTETNASVSIGDMVYIMYDENMSYDIIEQHINDDYCISSTLGILLMPKGSFIADSQDLTYYVLVDFEGNPIDSEVSKSSLPTPDGITQHQSYYSTTGSNINKKVLDSCYEFSGSTSLGIEACDNWIYLKQIQGYEVFDVNETNNEITIKRFYDSSLNNIKLYNHYLCKIYVHKIKIYGGWVDGVCFRKVDLNNVSDTSIDIDVKQCIVLSGGTGTSDISAYYTHMKDKYDSQYVSVNSNLISGTNKIPTPINPYKYKSYNIVKTNDSPTTSFYTYNNKSFGYSYLHFTKFYNSKIDSGYYNTCIISGGTISGGDFINCYIYDTIIESGSFTNCNLDTNSTWYYGIWYGSGNTFGPKYWWNGVWNEGIFSGKTWITGIFNAGIFKNSVWVNGIFNGGGSIFSDNNQEDFINSIWSGGTFNNGWIKDSIWIGGKFNGGTVNNSTWFNGVFNNGIIFNSFWSGGTFNNGTFNTSYWFSGTFNNGTFINSNWYNGTFNNGSFNTGYGGDILQMSGITYKWYNGIFNNGTFSNSVWLNGTFNNGQIKSNSIWSGGTFNFGKFDNSVWLYGNWNNGVVNNSTFHRCNWKNGTFNSGYMGKEYQVSSFNFDSPIVHWSGGTFNNGVFGSETLPSVLHWYNGDFFGGKFYNYSPNILSTNGFLNGIFHEGYFYGDYWGGHWINGFFSSTAYNHTKQLIPSSIKYNYQGH